MRFIWQAFKDWKIYAQIGVYIGSVDKIVVLSRSHWQHLQFLDSRICTCIVPSNDYHRAGVYRSSSATANCSPVYHSNAIDYVHVHYFRPESFTWSLPSLLDCRRNSWIRHSIVYSTSMGSLCRLCDRCNRSSQSCSCQSGMGRE